MTHKALQIETTKQHYFFPLIFACERTSWFGLYVFEIRADNIYMRVYCQHECMYKPIPQALWNTKSIKTSHGADSNTTFSIKLTMYVGQ